MVSYRKIRIKFFKTGPLKFISHLDTDRTFKSVIARAGVNVEFSHGFNPRPQLVFTQPLPLGVESVAEYLEIKAESSLTADEIRERLNACLPPDMQIISIAEPENSLKDAVSADYTYTLISPDINENTPHRVKELFSGSAAVEKRTKKGDTVLFDMAPFVKGLEAEYVSGVLTVKMNLPFSQDSYVNPEFAVRAMEKHLCIDLSDPNTSVYNTRKERVYTISGTEL